MHRSSSADTGQSAATEGGSRHRRGLVLGEDGHVGAELREVLLLPQGRDRLGLRVEVHASLCAARTFTPNRHTATSAHTPLRTTRHDTKE